MKRAIFVPQAFHERPDQSGRVMVSVALKRQRPLISELPGIGRLGHRLREPCPAGAIRIEDELVLFTGETRTSCVARLLRERCVRPAAAELQPMWCADADACAPGIHPRSPK